MATEEKEKLLSNEDKQAIEPEGLTSGSKLKETMIIILAILGTNMLGLCVDSMPVTFFNYEAKKRGLTEYQNGIVMGSYDFGRLIVGPQCPILVRKITAKRSMMLGAVVCGISSVLFGFSYLSDANFGGKTKGLIDFIKLPGVLVLLMVLLTTLYGVLGSMNMIGDWVVKTFDVPISTWSFHFSISPAMYMIGNVVASAITNTGYLYSTIFAAAPVYILCFLFLCPSPLLAPLFRNKSYLPMTLTLFGVSAYLEAHILVPVYQALVNLALANGHDRDSLNNYAIISSAVNSAFALGSMMGPPLVGTTTQFPSFPWAATTILVILSVGFAALAAFLTTMRLLGKPLS